MLQCTHKARLCSVDRGIVPIRSIRVRRDQLSMMLSHTGEQGDSLNYWLWERIHLQPFWGYAPRKLFSVLSHSSCVSHHTRLKTSS